jgi:hypothetical protein
MMSGPAVGRFQGGEQQREHHEQYDRNGDGWHAIRGMDGILGKVQRVQDRRNQGRANQIAGCHWTSHGVPLRRCRAPMLVGA